MAYRREITVHYSCDFAVCKNAGKSPILPQDWRLIKVQIPGQDQQLEMIITACPACVKRLRGLVREGAFKENVKLQNLRKEKLEDVLSHSNSNGNSESSEHIG